MKKNPPKAFVIMSIAAFFLIIGVLWERYAVLTSASGPIEASCGCYCHHLHEQEMEDFLQTINEDRRIHLEEKRKQSEKLMKEQEEFCSRPFKEFREEIN